ncbi:MAG: ABC transporter substrate-binding protein [Deltaproteobacteria bacterium]|nr:ABC transporter substrate-binding protein [Deltaproteobacteria bacterium]MCL5276511.1 ABC transporter substrate-binding protein [Deltaproteobacteria bacterium]
MKKVFTVLVVALSLLSCNKHPPATSTLVIGIEGSPANLDPRYATDAYSGQIARLCFEGLMRYKRDGILAPLLAEDVVVKDNTTVLITLKKGIKFQDGSPFTAQDVLSTIEGIIKSGTYSPYKDALSHIKYISVPGPFSLIVHLKGPYAPILTAFTVGILPHRLAYRENIPPDALTGTGPYVLTAYRQARYVRLDAYDGYWRGPPGIKHVVFRVIPDDLMRVLELEKGSIDMLVNAVPPDSIESLEHDRHIKFIIGPGNNYEYIGFNMKDPILRIKEVRQAIAYAIDRPGIIRYVLFGQAEPAAGILPPWNTAYNPDLRQYTYDPSRAKRLLDQAGFPEKDGYRFVLDYKTSNNPLSMRVAQAIAYELGQVGIKVDLRSYEWATFYNDIRHGNFQMYTLRWVNVMDPSIFYYAFDSKAVPPYGANRGYYSNPEVDRLIGRAMELLNINDSAPLYRRVQSLIAGDLPYISLWYMNDVTALRDRVHGFEPFPGGGYIGIEKAFIGAPKR